jgi:hypothetical protein
MILRETITGGTGLFRGVISLIQIHYPTYLNGKFTTGSIELCGLATTLSYMLINHDGYGVVMAEDLQALNINTIL